VIGDTAEKQAAINRITVTAILHTLMRLIFGIDNGILCDEFFMIILSLHLSRSNCERRAKEMKQSASGKTPVLFFDAEIDFSIVIFVELVFWKIFPFFYISGKSGR